MTLRLASYNIHAAVGTDRRRDIKRIAAVIGEIAPDVIALQEVDTRRSRGGIDQAQVIAAELGMNCIEGPIFREGDGWYGNAILTTRPASNVTSWRYPVHSRSPRAALGVSIVDRTEQSWRIIATHLDLRYRCRLRQVRSLGRMVSPAPVGPLAILGDLNEWMPWAQSWPVLRELGEVPAGVKTFPSWCPMLRLDRVVLYGCRLHGELRRHVTPLSRRASDHLPIYVDVEADDAIAAASQPLPRPVEMIAELR